MFSITLNPTSPAELSAYLDIIKASGLHLPAASASPATPQETLADRYKRVTGKSKASLSGEELAAVGWDGARADVPQAIKEKAMQAAIDKAQGEAASDTLTEEQGAVYEPEGEIPEPDASELDY